MKGAGHLGFSVLLKDTLTCGQEKPEIKLPTLLLKDNMLYLLSHNPPCKEHQFAEL